MMGLVLAAQGVIDYKVFLFAHVGADSENPGTLEYLEQYAHPYAAAHGLTLIELTFTKRDGSQPTLYEKLIGDNRTVPIPMRMSNGAPGRRSCTVDYKIGVVDRWLKAQGASAENPAMIGLGISIDEYQRMRAPIDPDYPYKVLDYPLIDLKYRVDDAARILGSAGLPMPPKSACWYCPFQNLRSWREKKEHDPLTFTKAINLEARINEKRAIFGKDAIWLTRKNMPIDQAVAGTQHDMFDDEAASCESGYCMT